MPRERKNLDRISKVRDTRTYFLIATEGTETEKIYFDALYQQVLLNPALNKLVKIEVLERETSASSPDYILGVLDQYAQDYLIYEGDELWLVIDRDKNTEDSHIANLVNVVQRCEQKGYFVALSNPCFELWLLLHLTEVTTSTYSVDKLNALLDNKKRTKNSRTPLEQELIIFLKSYQKNNYHTTQLLNHVNLAIDRAKKMDTTANSGDRWQDYLGTRVYLLVDKVLQADII